MDINNIVTPPHENKTYTKMGILYGSLLTS